MTILDEVKSYLGLDSDDSFDTELKNTIDDALAQVSQISLSTVDLSSGDEFPFGNHGRLMRSYVCYSVRLAFDPPPTSFAIECISKLKEEAAWRMSIQKTS